MVTPSLCFAKSIKDISTKLRFGTLKQTYLQSWFWEKEKNLSCRFSHSSLTVYFSIPSKYPKNELLTQTLGKALGSILSDFPFVSVVIPLSRVCLFLTNVKRTHWNFSSTGIGRSLAPRGYLLCWGTRECAIFLDMLYARKFQSRIYFLPQNSKVGYQFWRKILKQGNTLLWNRSNFFVEHMTWSQNQPYCLKYGKIFSSISKITENVRKFQN